MARKQKIGPTFYYRARSISPTEILVVKRYLSGELSLWDATAELGYKGENAATRRMLYVAKTSLFKSDS